MSQINNYPIVVDFENATFVVETESGTRRLNFSQLADYFNNIVNAGGIGEAKSTAAEALQAALSANNTANDAVERIDDVIQKNISRAYIDDGHLYIVLNDETTIDAGIVNDNVAQYGVCRDIASGNPILSRVGAAANFEANVGIGDKIVRNDFDEVYPWCDMKRCTLSDNGTVTSYKGDANYVEDGSIGQVMVEIPKFYTKHYIDEVNQKEYWYICKYKLEGYILPQAFVNANGDELDKIYIGAYFSATENQSESDIATSINNHTYPDNTMNYKVMRAQTKARGVNWHNLDAMELFGVIQPLFIVEWANLDSEAVFSGCIELNGNKKFSQYNSEEFCLDNTNIIATEDTTDKSDILHIGQEICIILGSQEGFTPDATDEYVDGEYYLIRKITAFEQRDECLVITISGSPINVDANLTFDINSYRNGVANDVVASSGVCFDTDASQSPFVWRGIENLYLFNYTWVVGILSNRDNYYLSEDLTKYENEDSYEMLEYGIPANGYISELRASDEHPWALLPSATIGSDADNFCDYLTSRAGTTKNSVRFGGNAVGSGGLFCLTSNFSPAAITGLTRALARLSYKSFN